MKKWLNDIVLKLHEKGLAIPLIRNHGIGSVSLTLLWISSITVLCALFQLGKVSFWESLAWHVTCAVLYYNKTAKISKDGFEIGTDKEGE